MAACAHQGCNATDYYYCYLILHTRARARVCSVPLHAFQQQEIQQGVKSIHFPHLPGKCAYPSNVVTHESHTLFRLPKLQENPHIINTVTRQQINFYQKLWHIPVFMTPILTYST
jgi:hypothetical protein